MKAVQILSKIIIINQKLFQIQQLKDTKNQMQTEKRKIKPQNRKFKLIQMHKLDKQDNGPKEEWGSKNQTRAISIMKMKILIRQLKITLIPKQIDKKMIKLEREFSKK